MDESINDTKKNIGTEKVPEILEILETLQIERFDFHVYEKEPIHDGSFAYEIAITALKKEGANEEVIKFKDQRLRNIICKADLEVETYYIANKDGTIEKYFPNL